MYLYYLFLNPLVTFSWRGAVIDTDQATEGTKDGEKEDLPANQEAKLSKNSGICCFIYNFLFSLWISIYNLALLTE